MVSRNEVVRRLSAVLIADVVGYVPKMRDDEMSTHIQVKADFEALLAPRVVAHHGRVVKTTGDGIHAEFGSVVDAVECAIEIQRASGVADPGPEQSRLQYRLAINLGDVIIEENDIYGDAVNIAVRLQGITEPGGIFLSGDAYRHVKGKTKFAFEALGERQLKGVAEPIEVFRVAPDGATSGKEPARRPGGAATLPAAPSIAVLPLEDLNPDKEQNYFSDGITNDLITDLSKFSELFVIASDTAFTYKGKDARIQDVGRELAVRYVVTGSVRRAGDRIRININLVDSTTGRHIWAERYDRPTTDLFELQDEIVQTVVGTLVTRVHHSENQRVLSSKPDKFQAYDAYLRGRAVWQSWTGDANREARDWFNRAIELDPSFSLAYGYLSYTLVQGWLGGWTRDRETLERARQLAQKAVELGPSEFDNHWSLAAAYLHDREFDKAMAAYRRAYELNPNSPSLLVDLSEALVYVGRVDEAVQHVERAMRLNPIYPDWYLWTLGIVLYHAGEYQRALEALLKMSNPANLSRRHLIATNVRLGRMAEARRVAAEFMANEPTYTLDRERVWPYRDEAMREQLVADLRSAGLPDIASNGNRLPGERGEGRHGQAI